MSNPFHIIRKFEDALCEYTGAPYAVMTDCCTHAIELCLRYCHTPFTFFPANTYISIPMTMKKLNIEYGLVDFDWYAQGEYEFQWSPIWDSARRLQKNMYRPGMMQCLSFGHGKPLPIGHGGAILLDDPTAYQALIRMRYDGRDIYNVDNWQDQPEYQLGFHYRPTIEDAQRGLELLSQYHDIGPQTHEYPDLKKILFKTVD